MGVLGEQIANGIISFFENLWPNQSGYMRVARGNKRTSFFQESFFSWPEDYDKLHSLYALSSVNDDYYYSCTLFSQPKANKQFALPCRWLWADLDYVSPSSFPSDFPQPTFVVQTSPNRYQALWLLAEEVDASVIEQYTKGVTYTLGADPSGWDVGQFLRLPGTSNQKYPDSPLISFSLSQYVYPVCTFDPYRTSANSSVDDEDLQTLIDTAQSLNPEELISKYNLSSDPILRDRVMGDGPESNEDRSAYLWSLERVLAGRGVTIPEIAAIASISPYNKYARQDREWKQLIREAIKAKELREEVTEAKIETQLPSSRKLVGISAKALSEKQFPPLRWVIDGILPQDEPLIIGGTYQSRKTFVALELATALSTGCPFLGHFKTVEKGRVLYIQEEMTERQINERMRMICQAREVDFPEHVIFVNQKGFLLDQPSDRTELEEFIDRHNIQYVIFDPLGKQLSKSDINSSNDMSNITRWLVQLEQSYGVIDIMVHHMNKQLPGKRLADSISGSWAIPAHYASKLVGSLVDNYGRIVKWERKTRMMGENPEIFVTFNHDKETGAYSTSIQESLTPDEQRASQGIVEVLNQLGRDEHDKPKKIGLLELAPKLRITETQASRLIHDLARQNKCTVYSQVVDGVRLTFVSAPVWTAADIEKEFDAYLEENIES